MARRALFLALLLLAVTVAPAAEGVAPASMSVAGTVRVNGAAPPAGTVVGAYVGAEGPFAQAATGANGTYALQVPADDPETDAREGVASGESVTFRTLGGTALVGGDATFAPGASRNLTLTFFLPDLTISGVSVAPTAVAEGERVTVTGVVRNRAAPPAQDVRVSVTDDGRILASAFLGELAANASRGFTVEVPTAGLEGNRTWAVVASASNGDADPSSARAFAGVAVEGDLAPRVVSFAHVPAEPAPGEPVTLLLEPADADGIAFVHFHWDDGRSARSFNLTTGPFQVSLGAFPNATTVRYHAVVADAGPLGKTTTTSTRTFLVGGGAADEGGGLATPTPPTYEGEGGEPLIAEDTGAGRAIVMLVVAGLLVAGGAFALLLARHR